MITTFHVPADELNLSILKSIKEAFKGKNIEIIVSETRPEEKADILLRRMGNLKNDKNTVTFSQESFFKSYRKKVADAINKFDATS